MKTIRKLLSAEHRITACTFLLGLSGVLTIASSQSDSSLPLYLVLKQLSFLMTGMVFLFICAKIKFSVWLEAAPALFFLSWLLLILLLFFGSCINGMHGWFRLGPLSFQPSETGRPFFLLALTVFLTAPGSGIKRFLLISVPAVLWLIPIGLQPDFGTAVIYAAGFIILVFLAGAKLKWLLLPIAGGALAAGCILLKYRYVWNRFTGFWNPDADPFGSGWHVRQFELAVARGEWFGSKLGGAVWSNAYLPFSYNDSAGATLLETLGLAGALIPTALFIILLVSFSELAQRQTFAFQAKLFTAGTAVFLGIQMLIHMGINLTLLPPSGLILPFISYGGSSLAGYCIMTGICLSAASQYKANNNSVSNT